MSINWEQLLNIVWLLIIFVAPAIIGAVKKKQEEKEGRKENPNRPKPGLGPDNLLGDKPVKQKKEVDNPLMAYFANLEDDDEEDIVIPPKREEKKAPPRKTEPLTKRPFVQKTSPAKANPVTPSNVQRNDPQKDWDKQRLLIESRLKEAKELDKKEAPVLTSPSKASKARERLGKAPASYKDMIVWSEILGPPKANRRSRSRI